MRIEEVNNMQKLQRFLDLKVIQSGGKDKGSCLKSYWNHHIGVWVIEHSSIVLYGMTMSSFGATEFEAFCKFVQAIKDWQSIGGFPE